MNTPIVACQWAVTHDHEPHHYLSAIVGGPGEHPPQVRCWCPGVPTT